MNEWVATRDRALDFVGTVMAVQTATRLDLKGVEIVLLSDNSNTEVVVAIPLDQKIRHASGERL